MPKIRLTKKRLAQLEMGLHLDDILYEKFQRLNDELNRKYRRLYQAERVIQVVQKRNGMRILLPVLEVNTTPEGTQVIVGP